MQATKRNKKLTYALIIAAMISVMGLVGVSVAGANDGGGACHGTYYVEVDSGSNYALWTFNQDGTFQGTDSAETEILISHQQGAWQHTRAREAKATWLDFSFFDFSGSKATRVARVDAELEFGDGFQTFDGDYKGAVYTLGQDPLDPTTPPAFTFSGLFTGQRVNP